MDVVSRRSSAIRASQAVHRALQSTAVLSSTVNPPSALRPTYCMAATSQHVLNTTINYGHHVNTIHSRLPRRIQAMGTITPSTCWKHVSYCHWCDLCLHRDLSEPSQSNKLLNSDYRSSAHDFTSSHINDSDTTTDMQIMTKLQATNNTCKFSVIFYSWVW